MEEIKLRKKEYTLSIIESGDVKTISLNDTQFLNASCPMLFNESLKSNDFKFVQLFMERRKT